MSAQDEVAEFAALLRELKERTDRSYGSLARRLNMNTSTLHRYCAGEAVPVDFAPVERFAALCGASGTERVELHRRWLRAAEARRHPRGPDGGSAGAAGGAPTGPVPGPGPAAGPRSMPAWSSDVAVGASDAGRAGAGAGESAPQGGPVAEGGAVGGTRAAEAGGRRPWYRRRERVGVAVAAVCALLATVGSLSALPDDRRPSGGRENSGAPPRTSAPAGTAAKPHSRSSPPTPSATASGTGSAAPERRPGAPGSPRGTTAPPEPAVSGGPPPLTWSADSHVWAYGCGHDYVVARPPRQVPPPPAPQDARTWAEAQSAVHGGETRVELSVQGTSDTAVVLTALRVRVTGRAAPAPGNVYAMDEGCGGALTPRYFDVDLDKDRPIARAVAGNDAGTPIPAVRMPYRVSATDPEVLAVTARTGACDCSWYLELDWSSQGRTGTVRVDDHGRPFRTSGVEELPRYAYDTSVRDWRPHAE
ncbi:DNA-binding protein [Streptomyces toyocaensis]|uniref:DNA-binding protein n=1 Tax=Streptomyces toyocaensis TaxID=55952 RepID=A0A081XYE2_STRTO|nr:helix-turn-helix transcriptional regulator [Streptomyces toyocaensis]KES08565.1 DNA-binding protein [Streptomyces toyocaensis]